jgi:hypothetical protein
MKVEVETTLIYKSICHVDVDAVDRLNNRYTTIRGGSRAAEPLPMASIFSEFSQPRRGRYPTKYKKLFCRRRRQEKYHKKFTQPRSARRLTPLTLTYEYIILGQTSSTFQI